VKISLEKLGSLAKIQTGKLDANASSSDGEYPFFTCARAPLKISSYTYDCECVLVAGNGDLNVKYFNGKFDAYQRTYIVESKDKNRLDVRYLYHFMDTYLVKLREQSIGGIIKYIKLGNLTEAIIPRPSLPDQKRIAAILNKAETLRDKRRASIAKLDELLQSVFLDMFGNPLTNPMKWEERTLEDIGTLDRGVSKHRPRNAPELLGGEYPLIQTGDVANSGGYIRDFTNTYSEIGLQQSKLWPKGTLCITIAANIANTGILMFDSCFPDSVVGFTPNKDSTAEFVQSLLGFLRHMLDAKASQVAQKNINLKILRALVIPCPPLHLQKKYSKIAEKIEAQKRGLIIELKKLDTLFVSLQQQAFRGEL
jgi:type I restriction enzyme S subunit